MPLDYEECDIHVYLDYAQERQSKMVHMYGVLTELKLIQVL